MPITLRKYGIFLSNNVAFLPISILVLYQLHYSFTITHNFAPYQSLSSSLPTESTTSLSSPQSSSPYDENVSVVSRNNSFGACLMIKEDNNLLVEWLAYHYTVLPLRYVVVGSDINNTQDPSEILRRWSEAKTDLRYKVFNDREFIHRHGYKNMSDFIISRDHRDHRDQDSNRSNSDHKLAAAHHHFFIHRQLGFITACSEWMKRQGIGWVTYIDSDEFIVLNRLGQDDEKFKIGGPGHYNSIQQVPYNMRKSIPPIKQNVTVLDVIRNVTTKQSRDVKNDGTWNVLGPCYTMPRLIVGALENKTCTNAEATKNLARTNGFPISEMSSLRFFQHAKKGDFQANRFGKVFVNLANISEETISRKKPKNPHRPFPPACGPAMVHFPESLFYINHYIGSWERYNSRSDSRRNRQEWEKRSFYSDGISCDKAVHDWFPRFVESMGMERAKYLLGLTK